MVDTTVKVHYFPAQGACQGIRYTLVAGGVAFEDVPAKSFPPTQEDKDLWRSLGKNTTTNVPMIVVGDKVYTQSTAVIRQAARLAKLEPTGDDDLYLADKLLADASDLASTAQKAIKMFGATPEAEKKFINEDLVKHVEALPNMAKYRSEERFTKLMAFPAIKLE